MTYKIYRVENSSKEGPYWGECPGSSLMNRAHILSPVHHPNPHDEGEPFHLIKDSEKRHYIFGFLTLENLFKWFKDWMQDLYARGFRIVVYECSSKPLQGRTQIAFRKDSSVILESETEALNQPEQVATYI